TPSLLVFLEAGTGRLADPRGGIRRKRVGREREKRAPPATTFDWSAATNQARSRASDQANFSQPFSAALAGESSGVAMAQTNPTRRMVNPLTIFMSLTFHFWPDAKP